MAVAFDEMTGANGDLRPAYRELARWLEQVPPDALEFRRREAEVLFRRTRAFLIEPVPPAPAER